MNTTIKLLPCSTPSILGTAMNLKAVELKESEMKTADAANEEEQMRILIEDWAEALRIKDVDRYVSRYAKDIRLFEMSEMF